MKALITGGSGGIGSSICNYFKQKGITVINPSRDELDLSNPNKIKDYLSNCKLKEPICFASSN